MQGGSGDVDEDEDDDDDELVVFMANNT